MKHPTILPGRQGLPPTSNVPWSASDEKWQRSHVLIDFIFMWIAIVSGIAFSWMLRHGGLFTSIIAWGSASAFMFYRLQASRRKLYAMLLNKPRDTRSLTQWVWHRWEGWDVEQRQFLCRCGRLVDLSTASYFKESRRYSKVCECGVGHFLVPPSMARPMVKQ